MNPVSYLIECVRSLIITGWNAEALALGFGFAVLIGIVATAAAGAQAEAGADMRTLAGRVRRSPGGRCTTSSPPDAALSVAPLSALLLHRLRGRALAGLNVPGFDFPPGYTAFQFCFVLLQSAAFGGVFTGFGIARDFEYGFARRLLLAAPNRTGIMLGYAVAAVVRWVVTATS